MSIGVGAHADLYVYDNETVIYKYGGYNLNIPEYRNEEHKYDGIITINRDCFVEPEIHEKLKKTSGGRKKLVVKRIPREVDYGQMIKDRKIIIENCSNCWECTSEHIDVMALHVLFKLFRQYQEEGKLPDCVNYNV